MACKQGARNDAHSESNPQSHKRKRSVQVCDCEGRGYRSRAPFKTHERASRLESGERREVGGILGFGNHCPEEGPNQWQASVVIPTAGGLSNSLLLTENAKASDWEKYPSAWRKAYGSR